jgi:hypothetical protein
MTTFNCQILGDIGSSKLGNHEPPFLQPWLSFNDLRMFGRMKMHLGGQKFQTGDELKNSVLNWLHSQDKIFYAAGISNLPWQWTKCGSAKGEYLGKEEVFGYSGICILCVKNQVALIH